MTSYLPTRVLRIAIVLVLASPLALVGMPAASAATTRTLAITTASAHPTVPFQGFDSNPPKVYDINGDGRLEIIAQNDNQWVYIFDSASGALLFEGRTTLPAYWGARSFNGPEVSVMKQGGVVRLIVENSAATVTSFRFDAVASTSLHFAFVREWERRLSDCHADPGADSKPVLADLDRDGVFEILAATEEQGLYALRADGSILWKNCMGGGNADPGVTDLNLDGYPDVVYGSDGGVVSALNGRTGGFLWTYYLPAHFTLGSASMPVGPGIGQLDGLAGPDIVVGARDSHNGTDFTQDHAMLVALSSTGALLWARQDPQGNPLTYTRPVVVDADRDGVNEVYWGDWNTIGHKPPANEADAWKVTGPAHYYRYDRSGTMVWRQTLPTWWSNKDVPLADVDGDGVQEMLANTPNAAGHDGIQYLDTRTGALEAFVDLYPWKLQRAPVVADLYGDGMMEWVAEAGPAASAAGSGGAILVYSTGVRYSSAWPHVPYPTPGAAAPPPPPAATFAATFTVKNPNTWWEELYVTAAGHTITGAEVRVNGGPWYTMAKSSWGAWTASVNAPAGAQVQFLAHDSVGAESTSQPFTWMDGTTTRSSTTGTPPPPPPPTGYSATFTPAKNCNNWWVEVSVTASRPPVKVEAQVGSGSWVTLASTSWGTWAKSFNVPSGATVHFRATAAGGETATSGAHTWP